MSHLWWDTLMKLSIHEYKHSATDKLKQHTIFPRWHTWIHPDETIHTMTSSIYWKAFPFFYFLFFFCQMDYSLRLTHLKPRMSLLKFVPNYIHPIHCQEAASEKLAIDWQCPVKTSIEKKRKRKPKQINWPSSLIFVPNSSNQKKHDSNYESHSTYVYYSSQDNGTMTWI